MNALRYLAAAALLLLAGPPAYTQDAPPLDAAPQDTASQDTASQDTPSVRADVRLIPSDDIDLGATATLEVDVLTSTWFTQPPQLPPLQLPGALVTPPAGEADLLNLSRDGIAYTGLRYRYLITPTSTEDITVPALVIGVQPGQGTGLVQVSTKAMTAEVQAPPEMFPHGTTVPLPAAAKLRATQRIIPSEPVLKVGDSVTREVIIDADGTPAILIPPVAFAEIPGMRRYVKDPVVTKRVDGRGGFLGGRRVDTVDYVIEERGAYTLPAIDLEWWSTRSRSEEHLKLAGAGIKADAVATYSGPFSVADDIETLSRSASLPIPALWLFALALLTTCAVIARAARARGRRALAWLSLRADAARQAWRGSETCAWLALKREHGGSRQGLDSFYRWVFRLRGERRLEVAVQSAEPELRKCVAGALHGCYGRRQDRQAALNALHGNLGPLRRQLRSRTVASAHVYALAPLNPRLASRRCKSHRRTGEPP
jgi:hypothetical protein